MKSKQLIPSLIIFSTLLVISLILDVMGYPGIYVTLVALGMVFGTMNAVVVAD